MVGRALAHGRGTALASVLGNAFGVEVVAICVALGVGTLVQRSAVVFTAVKLAGGLYLVWLGGSGPVRQRRGLVSAFTQAQAPRGGRRAALEGFVVGVANPKAIILFAAVLPGFVNRQAGEVPGQMILLSLVSFTIALASDSAWSLVASTARSWFGRSPRRLELVGGAGWPGHDRPGDLRGRHRPQELTGIQAARTASAIASAEGARPGTERRSASHPLTASETRAAWCVWSSSMP